MLSCEQTKGQNVLEHGLSVKDYLFDLLGFLRNKEPLKYNWILPEWLKDDKIVELILLNLPSDETLELYTTYHDCGKPFCLTIDDTGKKHFPNHTSYSYYYFTQIFDNDIAADLILHDMDIHLIKATDELEFSTYKYALTLLLSGLSEIHSNARMFGGIDSVSFKIKWKNIAKRGGHVLNLLMGASS